MAKTKILLVAPFPPPNGGIAKYVQDIWDSKELRNEFDFCRLNTARGEGLISGSGRGDNTWSRWKLFLQPRNWGFLFYAVLDMLEFLFKCLWIRPNVIHVHTCSYFGFIRSGIFMFLARPFRTRRILHLHNSIDVFYENNRRKPLWLSLILWSINQADELVVLSDGLNKWLRKNLNRDAYVVWNACDVDLYKMRDREALDLVFPAIKGKIVVLLVGGLHEHKGAFDILQVASELSPAHKASLAFILPGHGDMDRAIQFVSRHHLEENVLLAGVVSDKLKATLLCGADIFVLPSYSEGQPIAIIEAMAASLPIISTYIGSIPEIVENGCNGYLIQPGDKEQLKMYIRKLANNPELRATMGTKSRRRAEENHTMKRLFSSISRLYYSKTK